MSLNLFGKLGFDASSFTRAMAGMKAAAGPAGSQIGQQIRGKMLEAFGAGAAIALFKKSIDNAMNIRSGAMKSGLDTSTFQALEAVAKNAGSSVEELVKILAEGGPEADTLREALAAAQDELTRTGQIIDSDTVKKLAELGDKMQAAFGRVAPILAQIIDWIMTLGDWIGRGVDAAVAGAQIAYGQAFGDAAQVQAGREGAREAFAARPEAEQSAVRAAAETAARIVREDRNSSGGGGGRGGSRPGHSMPISGLVAAGAQINVGVPARYPALDVMARETRRIRELVERPRD